MKYNTQEVAALQPDFLGFIFYGKSKRDFGDLDIPLLPDGIKKVGVFVDAEIAFAKQKIIQHKLDIIQLHGDESPEYITALKNAISGELNDSSLDVWKVFGIKDSFDFNKLHPYEGLVHAFLFDTKGKEKGGNGYTFNWTVLQNYTSSTPIILSGGIGLEEIDNIKEILATNLPIVAIDINSRFEVKPGFKNAERLKTFINEIERFKIQNIPAKTKNSYTQK